MNILESVMASYTIDGLATLQQVCSISLHFLCLVGRPKKSEYSAVGDTSRPFTCHVCSLSVARYKYLAKHYKRMHPGLTPSQAPPGKLVEFLILKLLKCLD